ncbi:FkbM family methyltransferase [bacterium]|nr:FkbM family methyltransferase [bacterium]
MEIDVNFTTLKDYLNQNNIKKIDILKMDIE